MAITQAGTPVSGGSDAMPPPGPRHRRRWFGWLLGLAAGLIAVLVAVSVAAAAYQPLGLWNLMGGFPGLHRPAGERVVNTFGAETGQMYIPHQRQVVAVPVSLVNSGPFPVRIEAVSLFPPGQDRPLALSPAGPALYWTSRMTTGPHPMLRRQIHGLMLAPGNEHGIYVAIQVRSPRCYIERSFAEVDDFYVLEQFGPFSRWARIPLLQPLLLNTPAQPPGPGPDTVCPGG